ncbi:YbaB/EbfC family nucleoid-associated protein [Helicobacter mastomyrinus]|uniref:Nucleoid-associated protein V3I05_00945 n=1 Tax=Helicobacter mastomyrinus TaxID=287948 RepID=A0ABZ3F898_9HELI|nr:YbaB/EbfC family nucleoid-associated protein [uncultured Helicobacter sp.]
MFDPNEFGAMLGSMQDSIKELEEQNKQTILTAKSGGGLVSISCNGSGEVIDMSIDDSLLEDKESLQILLISAFNDLRKSVEDNRQSTAMNLLSGLGGFNIFGGKPNG